MDVVLINPLECIFPFVYPTNRPPYDLLYVESYLASQGLETCYLDFHNQLRGKKCGEYIEQNADARLFVINTTGSAYHYRAGFNSKKKEDKPVRDVIQAIRRHIPHAVICLIGETVSLFPEKYSQYDFDCYVFDEPEYTVYDLVKNGVKVGTPLSSIPGLGCNVDGVFVKNASRRAMRSLDEVPFPRWDKLGGFYWDSAFRESNPFIDIPGMRGCPHNCTFCKSSLSKKHVSHSPESVIRVIRLLHEQYGYADFFIRDAGSFDDMDRCVVLCDGLKGIPNITWKCNARIDRMSEEKIKLLKEAGCTLVAYGVESGNDSTLIREHKEITIEAIKEGILLTKKHGIKVVAYLILDLPGEGWREKLQTIAFAKELGADMLFINQYYVVKKEEGAGLCFSLMRLVSNILLLAASFFNSPSTVYFHKLRVDNVFVNFQHVLSKKRRYIKKC